MMEFKKGLQPMTLCVNGEARTVLCRPADTLLQALRDCLGLTGAKPGCENGDCGACTVIMDGLPVKSCLVLACEAATTPAVSHDIRTVEGLVDAPIQAAFADVEAFQCGYCTSGFLMAAQALIENHPHADEYTMEHWLQSNICRCTSYAEIRKAVERTLE